MKIKNNKLQQNKNLKYKPQYLSISVFGGEKDRVAKHVARLHLLCQVQLVRGLRIC